MLTKPVDVIIVGGGLAGLNCARYLEKNKVSYIIAEASRHIGGRIKTDLDRGFLLDRGFQVLQTAYPIALELEKEHGLKLNRFPPGVMIRLGNRFYTLADPRRMPRYIYETMFAPVGTIWDRIRLARLAHRVSRGSVENLFKKTESTTIRFLRANGFSEQMIRSFFVPFFGGVCLDHHLNASSLVFKFVFRLFASGDAALPDRGMQEIPQKIARPIPTYKILTGKRVVGIDQRQVAFEDGQLMRARAVVLATEGPETQRLLGKNSSIDSLSETCLYYSTKNLPLKQPFLILNGNEEGPINNISFPSMIAPTYAPPGRHLVSVVVLGLPDMEETILESLVRAQLIRWFGPMAKQWQHLRTYFINHALPNQSPPIADPTVPQKPVRPGLYICGELGSLPGIHWALLSGHYAAKSVLKELNN
jgi:phytoene dehydrogenase-like protein